VAEQERGDARRLISDVRPAEALGELNSRMGIEITDWTPERMVATMPVEGNRQPYGLLHGGASCVLAEMLGSTAAAVLAGPGRFPVGVEINATHHRSAVAGKVTAVCTPLHTGRSMASFQIEITDEHGRRTCTARLTCAYLHTRPGSG
jgi:1,4-dihydroxy-2-naphthoyl-CoA hydrolase